MNNCLRNQIGQFWNALKVADIALFVWAEDIIWIFFFFFFCIFSIWQIGKLGSTENVHFDKQKTFFIFSFGKQAIEKRHGPLH